jgi:hypothetical protein
MPGHLDDDGYLIGNGDCPEFANSQSKVNAVLEPNPEPEDEPEDVHKTAVKPDLCDVIERLDRNDESLSKLNDLVSRLIARHKALDNVDAEADDRGK